MSIPINSNILSLKLGRQLNDAVDTVGQSYERLSTGLRINSADDDSAGLAIAMALRVETRLATVALRNANDGVSMLAVSDSSLNEITNMLTRMRELAEQSLNGVYTNTRRSALQSEFIALGSEIERIALTTEFNDIHLLSDVANVSIQVGFESFSNAQIAFSTNKATLQGLGLASAGSSQMFEHLIDKTEILSQAASRTALAACVEALDRVAEKRGMVGASESRLYTAIQYMQVAKENLSAAESKITDVDSAYEIARALRSQILEQACTSIMAQANLVPSQALKLLQTPAEDSQED